MPKMQGPRNRGPIRRMGSPSKARTNRGPDPKGWGLSLREATAKKSPRSAAYLTVRRSDEG